MTANGPMRIGLGLGLIVVIATTATTPSAALTSPTPVMTRLQHSRVVSYPSTQVWPTAIRYLRVDRGYTLVDRDQDAGFILFDFPLGPDPNAPQGRGSLELIEIVDAAGRPAVKLQVSTDAGPTHLPHAIAEGLSTKLRTERGQPAPPPRPDPPPTPPPAPDQPWAPLPERN